MSDKIKVNRWPSKFVSGGKRANIAKSDSLPDWFVGFGKDESCQFEGTWWDMICVARNILASENTKMVAPEFHHPDWRCIDEESPYDFEE